ncbi:uncharacterized protein Tco025E_05673 [Trypanosoma conorhini]|uniref:Uncharacterized protein n=1 Tax=Trypanosoma conorhini TaxID=83891 RepID=A0A3R7MHJ6_9TRYP|nr:uncharacterized protein Tco025E_05673 [Trypanosoma conorhini]RNF15227.1 hypothetical protein Tco025E_05673 [Trypanosoma conorhini]
MRGVKAAAAGGSSGSRDGTKKNRKQTRPRGAVAGRVANNGAPPGCVPARPPPHGPKADDTATPSARVGVPQQRVRSIEGESSVASPVMGTTTSSAAGSRSCAVIADPWVILQPPQPPTLLGWAARREATSKGHSAQGIARLFSPRTATDSKVATPSITNTCQLAHEFYTQDTVGSEGCAGSCSGQNAQRLEMRFASPSEKRRDFTRPTDPGAETAWRLEEEHHRRFRLALYRLQQMRPDPWWRLQSSLYYDAEMPEVLTCDEDLFFSRVAREVRDAGVTWLSLNGATL